MNVIIKCEDHDEKYHHESVVIVANDKTNCRWKTIQCNPQSQPLKQIEQQSTKHLESTNCLDTLSPSSPPSITSLPATSTTTTIQQTPFIGLSKFGEITTIEKNHINHHSQRLISDTPYVGLAQSYASIVENYPTSCNKNNRRSSSSNNNNSNIFHHPPEYRLTLPTVINTNSLDSASFIRRRNERERARVKNVNEGFDRLRKHLPLSQSQREKRLSKVETLRMAISYIKHLEIVLKTPKQER